MIYLSAGHNTKGSQPDPGAVANGYHEANLTVELRDLIASCLTTAGASFITDKDDERLSDYLRRIKPGSGSVVCEIHFNAGTEKATGAEVIVKAGASVIERKLADSICKAITATTGLFSRGVKDETQSHRGRLAVLHTSAGISVLPEICFITNKNDLALYNKGKLALAKLIADLLVQYDKLQS